MLFTQKNNIYFDNKVIFSYSILVYFQLMLILFPYLYYKNAVDYNINSKMIGYWIKIDPDQIEKQKASIWSNKDTYDKNTIVIHKDIYYKAMGDKNAGEPNDVTCKILYVSCI